MTRNIDSKKLKLIEEIASINSETELDRLVKVIQLVRLSAKHGESIFDKTKESINIDELKKNQKFSGIDRDEFNRLVKELDVQESIEELLSMID